MKQRTLTLSVLLAISIGVQLLTGLVFLFGDIGFDHPGKYGLSFNHAIGLIVLFATAILVNVTFIVAIIYRKWFD